MSNKPTPAEIQQKMLLLRQDYLDYIPNELAELYDLTSQLVSGATRAATFAELHHRLHKITGAAGTFGLSQLSKESKPIEQQFKIWVDSAEIGLSIDEINKVSEQINQLKNFLTPDSKRPISTTSLKNRPLGANNFSIWLVEDDPHLGQELSRQIESFGYQVEWFARITDVSNAIATRKPDLMLLDVFFEEENQNTTQVVQLIPEILQSDCSFIFMSAVDDFDSRVRAAQLKADGYFLKPLDVPSLMNKVSQLVTRNQMAPERVLIVDDDEHLAQHYNLALKNSGIDAQVLTEPKNLIQTIADFRPELVLMDLYMPKYSGPDLAGVIRQHEKWASLPIVFLSSETDIQKQNVAMSHGADDFLTKPISDPQLVIAMKVRINRFRQLNELITRDSLTGLLKHGTIKESLDNEVSRSLRTKSPLTIAMLDIDNFKAVNDQYGHSKGDLVICAISMLLKQRLRQHDIIGRYGGEEFLVLLPDCDSKSAFEIMQDIRERFSRIRFSYEKSDFYNSISIGIACSTDFPKLPPEDFLNIADQALYQSKQDGRNMVTVAKP